MRSRNVARLPVACVLGSLALALCTPADAKISANGTSLNGLKYNGVKYNGPQRSVTHVSIVKVELADGTVLEAR